VLAILAALSVSTLGLSGCNVRFSPYAAVVNGSEISQDQIHDALTAISTNGGYLCSVEAGGASQVAGAGEGTFNAAFSAKVLSILIQDKVIRQELLRLHLPEPPALAPIARSEVESALTPSSSCRGTGASVLAAFRSSYRALLLQFQADEDALAAHLAGTTLTPSALAALVRTHPGELSLACISVIIVPSKSEIASLRSRIARGASFAALARAHSIDQTTAPNGGAVGCIPAAEFSSPLNKVVAALRPGRVSNAIAFHGDWLLLLLTGRHPETYAELVSSFLSKEQSQLGRTIAALIRSAEVEVDPQYGTWNKTASLPRVEPNPGPPAGIVPNPSANVVPAT